jgi:hypothetical protein
MVRTGAIVLLSRRYRLNGDVRYSSADAGRASLRHRPVVVAHWGSNPGARADQAERADRCRGRGSAAPVHDCNCPVGTSSP